MGQHLITRKLTKWHILKLAVILCVPACDHVWHYRATVSLLCFNIFCVAEKQSVISISENNNKIKLYQKLHMSISPLPNFSPLLPVWILGF